MENKVLASGYFKKHYEEIDVDRHEYLRWHASPLAKQAYSQTFEVLKYQLDGLFFNNSLEIGCGPGTWTPLFIEKSRKITLIDISNSMIESAKESFKDKVVNFIVGDFQEMKIHDEKYDAIFCIRAIEYMENKILTMKKMFNLLKDDGAVFIITKNPYRKWVQLIKSFGRYKYDKFHSLWLNNKELENISNKIGFINVKTFPVIINIPIIIDNLRMKINQKIWSYTYKKRIKIFLLPFIESYILIAKKLG